MRYGYLRERPKRGNFYQPESAPACKLDYLQDVNTASSNPGVPFAMTFRSDGTSSFDLATHSRSSKRAASRAVRDSICPEVVNLARTLVMSIYTEFRCSQGRLSA